MSRNPLDEEYCDRRCWEHFWSAAVKAVTSLWVTSGHVVNEQAPGESPGSSSGRKQAECRNLACSPGLINNGEPRLTAKHLSGLILPCPSACPHLSQVATTPHRCFPNYPWLKKGGQEFSQIYCGPIKCNENKWAETRNFKNAYKVQILLLLEFQSSHTLQLQL